MKIIFGFAYLEVDRGDGRAPKIINARWNGEEDLDGAARVAGRLGLKLRAKAEALDAEA